MASSDNGIDGHGLTFGRFLDEAADRFADRPAVVSFDDSYGVSTSIRRTYAEMADDVRALHAGLLDAGVRPGEHVAVMLSSFYEWILYLFAVTRLGAAFVPVNPRFGSHELAHVLHHSGSSTLVAMGRYLGRDYASLIAEVVGHWKPGGRATNLPELLRIVGVRDSPHPGATMTDALLARGRQCIAGAQLSAQSAAAPDGSSAAPAAPAAPAASADDSDTAILFYTSGTTAFPKGVPLTHRNLLPHTIGCGALLGINERDRVLTLYPFFGISGGANKVLSTFAFGACLVFQDAFRAGEAFALLDDEQCTIVHGVDVQIRELVTLARGRTTALLAPLPPPSRRATIAFMAGLDEELARDMRPMLGIENFIHPYGMTEINPMVLRNRLDDPFEAQLRPGGRIAPNVEVTIVDPETGVESSIDEPGEIQVRGETVMHGYYRDPGATEAAFRRGWFRTGDQGVRTADGFVFYLGRLKDMLKIGGFNVAPQEVESYLRTHPAVEDVAVTGLPDERLGEVVVAFIKPKAGHAIDDRGISEFCRGHIANFKMPQRVATVDALPYHTAANGSKLRRDVLRAWAIERFSSSTAPAQGRTEPTRR